MHVKMFIMRFFTLRLNDRLYIIKLSVEADTKNGSNSDVRRGTFESKTQANEGACVSGKHRGGEL